MRGGFELPLKITFQRNDPSLGADCITLGDYRLVISTSSTVFLKMVLSDLSVSKYCIGLQPKIYCAKYALLLPRQSKNPQLLNYNALGQSCFILYSWKIGKGSNNLERTEAGFLPSSAFLSVGSGHNRDSILLSSTRIGKKPIFSMQLSQVLVSISFFCQSIHNLGEREKM